MQSASAILHLPTPIVIRNLHLLLLQKDPEINKKDTVVLLLQDMLEVVTRDMMVNENRLVIMLPCSHSIKHLMLVVQLFLLQVLTQFLFHT